MKICAVGLRGIPDIMGGIETHCQNLYPRLVERGAEVVVLARSPYIRKRQHYKGVEVIPVWTLKTCLLETALHTFICIVYARVCVRPDVIHLHAVGPGLMSWLARLLGMKVVFTHHGADYQRKKWGRFARSVLRLGEVLSIRFAQKVIVVGDSFSKYLMGEYATSQRKISHIPNGASFSMEELSGEVELGSIDARLQPGNFILFVGRLVPEKGLDDLIAAFCGSKSSRYLVVAGGADHKSVYADGIRRIQHARIIFLGNRTHCELVTLYRNAALFVLPSYHEGLPIAALEALGMGTPILLSNIEANLDVGLPEQCYFRVGDVDALKRKLDADSYAAYNAQHTVDLKRYCWDNIASQTYQLIEAQ